MKLKYKESTFEKLIYKFRSYYLLGVEKPKLNKGYIMIRRELAILLFRIDLKNVIFINEANIYSKYRKEYLWYTLEEYYYLDIKGSTTK